MSTSIENPFPVFFDNNGETLENGYIYIGTAGLNPKTSEIEVYWDSSFLYPAAQPIRTINGLPSRSGTPSSVFIKTPDYSITVENAKQVAIYSVLAFTGTAREYTSSMFADLDTAIATIGSTEATLFITTPLLVTANAVVPSTMQLSFLRGGSLNNGTKTVTINGQVNSGLFKIFDGTGAITFGTNSVGKVVPQWFGALGDGATDDTVAIQAALNVGGMIYFPTGAYLISSALDITVSGTVIIGAGMHNSVITTNSTTEDVFTVGDGVSPFIDIIFRDIGITSTVTKTAGAGIHFQRISGGGVYTCFMKKMFRGIRVTGNPNSNVLFLKDIIMQEVVASTGIGVSIEDGNDHYMQNIFVSSTPGSECLAGYEISNSGAVWMDNCGSLFCGDGLRVVPGAGQTVTWLFINRSAFDSGTGAGIKIVANDATATIRGCTFTDCWTASNDLDGVITAGVASSVMDGVYFNNHKSFNNENRGFHLTYGKNIHLNNCEAAGNSQASSGTYHGIEFAANISEWSVLNTMSGQEAGFGATQGYGLVVQAGTGSNYRVLGCDFRNNATGGFLDLAAGADRQILNNLPHEDVDHFVLGAGAALTRHLSATTTFDPPSLTSGASAGTVLTVTGAAAGDTVVASFDQLTNDDWQISGFVLSANTVRVVIINHTAGTVDLPSGTIRADVWKH